MTEIKKSNEGHIIAVDGKKYALIPALDGATDTFEKIEDGAWRWHRHTNIPTDHMRMEVILLGDPTFTMIPAVSYNGNGWGDTPEYVGDFAEDGTPWSFASHRVTIPACTYSENDNISIALMAEANDNCACSLYKTEEGKKHVAAPFLGRTVRRNDGAYLRFCRNLVYVSRRRQSVPLPLSARLCMALLRT